MHYILFTMPSRPGHERIESIKAVIKEKLKDQASGHITIHLCGLYIGQRLPWNVCYVDWC